MENGEGDPEDAEGEGADHAGEGVGEDDAAAGRDAFGRTRVFLVEDFVEPVHDGTDTDHEVAGKLAVGAVVRVLIGIRRAAGVAAVLGLFAVAVCDDEDADDGERDRDHFVHAEFVVEEEDGEDVGEEGGAVVDGGEVGRGGQVDGDVPGAAGHGEEGGDEGGGFDHVGPRGARGGGWREVEVLGLHHLGCGADEEFVSSPEGRPGEFALLDADDQQLDRIEC